MGADPLNTLKVSWTVPDFVGVQGFMDLAKKGTPVVVIDPLRTETARTLKAEWVPIRQRTDAAMMLGIMHTLHAENSSIGRFSTNTRSALIASSATSRAPTTTRRRRRSGQRDLRHPGRDIQTLAAHGEEPHDDHGRMVDPAAAER